MTEEPGVSPFSRRPAAPSAAAPSAFTRPAPPRTAAAPRTITPPRTVRPPKPARPVEVGENLPLGFMAGLVAAAIGGGLWALVTIITGFQIGWMAVGVGFLVGWAVRVAGKGSHPVFGYLGAALALGGCALGNLLAVLVIAARQFEVPLQAVFARLTPDVVRGLMETTFTPIHVLFYAIAIFEGYRFSITGRTAA
jgi:hypothetical protein